MDDYKIHVELAVDIPRDSKLGERIIAFSKASGKSPEQVGLWIISDRRCLWH